MKRDHKDFKGRRLQQMAFGIGKPFKRLVKRGRNSFVPFTEGENEKRKRSIWVTDPNPEGKIPPPGHREFVLKLKYSKEYCRERYGN